MGIKRASWKPFLKMVISGITEQHGKESNCVGSRIIKDTEFTTSTYILCSFWDLRFQMRLFD